MHDEWSEPMAAETRAIFRLAREEAPDWIVSLHSDGASPSIEPTAYVPRTVKESIRRLGDRVRRRFAKACRTARADRRRGKTASASRPRRSTCAAPCTTPAAPRRLSSRAAGGRDEALPHG